MVVRIESGDGEWKLADLIETVGGHEPEPPEYDFFGTCPKCLWGLNPVYNAKKACWEPSVKEAV